MWAIDTIPLHGAHKIGHYEERLLPEFMVGAERLELPTFAV